MDRGYKRLDEVHDDSWLYRLSMVLWFGVGGEAGGLLSVLDRLFIDLWRISSNNKSSVMTSNGAHTSPTCESIM